MSAGSREIDDTAAEPPIAAADAFVPPSTPADPALAAPPLAATAWPAAPVWPAPGLGSTPAPGPTAPPNGPRPLILPGFLGQGHQPLAPSPGQGASSPGYAPSSFGPGPGPGATAQRPWDGTPASQRSPLGLSAGAPPLEPPRLPRPDSGPTSGYWPVAPSQPPEQSPASPDPAPAPLLRPSKGWGWRALAAFVAGGLLTGGGFAAAELSRSSSSTTTTGPLRSGNTAPTTPPLTAAPVDPGSEPAAYVAQVLGPSVVQIETDFGIGSGVIYQDGLIMTNNHVTEGAVRISVALKDGRHLAGKLVGSNANADIAVVSVDKGQGLTPATLALGQKAQVGQIAVAIGSPFKLQQTITEGIVSAVDRPVPSGAVYTAMIQTDAPINPGNSGGALADRQGRVIGINTAIQTDGSSNTNAGIGFAIPIDFARSVADRLVAGKPIENGLLGVRGDAAGDGSAGVQVAEVTPGTAAETAGLKVGDKIVAVDGAPVTQFEELAGLVVAHPPGDSVELSIVRNGQPMTITATLGAR